MAKKKKVIQLLERVTDESSTRNISVAPTVNTNAMQLVDKIQEIPPVDGWVCPPEAELFKHVEKYIIIPVSTYFGVDNPNDILNFFDVSPKRCYNRPEMRSHLTTYLNYLTYYFDKEGELFMMYAKLKYMIDETPNYTMDMFMMDLKRYILLNKSLLWKVYLMNENNYQIELKAKKGRSIPSLQYTTKHGKILMQMSILMNIVIPLVTHYAHKHKLEPIDQVLLSVFDFILYMSDTDIYSKLYETASSEVERSHKLHKSLWDMQSIRGINELTHADESIKNIILNIMPKYDYSQNIISFNCTAIRNSNKYKITAIKYEYTFTKLSSSNRDADCQSDFDKYESFLIKQDEALALQNRVNCEQTMLNIEQMYGPFDEKEIKYYKQQLTRGDTSIFNPLQEEMIFNLFYKYFGDPKSINGINIDDYVKLMISANKILLSCGMVVLPYVISSKVTKMPSKKSINKKLITMITTDPLWEKIKEKYHDDEVVLNDILDKIGVAISSEYRIISMREPEYDGCIINYDNAILIAKEFMEFVLII